MLFEVQTSTLFLVKAEILEDHEIIEFNEESTELIDTQEAGTSVSIIETSPIEEKKKPGTTATSSKLQKT